MDNATLMSGTALARPAWDSLANGRVTPVTSGSPGDAMESEARKKTRQIPLEQPRVEQIEEMRAAINASSRSRLQIERAEEAGRFIYRIFDPATGQVMRQWPPENYVELVAYLRGREGGLVDQNV
jgi:flagellar protein FlaG